MSKNTIIAVSQPDHGAGNDPKPLGLAFHHQLRFNIFIVGNMRVMICHGQEGLHSPSASSCTSSITTHTHRKKRKKIGAVCTKQKHHYSC